MRIAFLYDAVYPYVPGGVQKRIFELAKRIARRHEIYIVGFRYWSSSKIKRYGNMIFYGLAPPVELYERGRRSVGEALYYSLNMAKMPAFAIKERIVLIDIQATPYVHYPLLHVLEQLALRSRVKTVATWHEVWLNHWYEYAGKIIGSVGRTVELVVARLARGKANIAVSPRTKLLLESLGISEVSIIPNGVDFKLISKIPPSRDLESDIVYAGRLTYEKKVELLLHAIHMLKKKGYRELKGLIIGYGPKKQALEKLVRDLGLEENVKLLDPIPSYRRLVSILKASKVFVLPSIREGFSIATLEANAAGLPVVTFDTKLNAAKDLIVHGYNGYRVRSVDGESLAEMIATALEEHKRMRSNCINFAAKMDWDLIAEKAERYYTEVAVSE
jgi:glycosyltransferase involved in cell wall biosynthesis